MIKHLFTLILLALAAIAASGMGTPENDNAINIVLARYCMGEGDTATALNILKQIRQNCERSDVWEDRFNCNLLLGDLNYERGRGNTRAAGFYRKAFDVYPANIAPNQDFLKAAYSLCNTYYEAADYANCEKYAANALVRSTAVVDSCFSSSGLFSLLANVYEHRGDTIMPQRFHQKAQELSIKYTILTEHPDSTELYNQRIAEQQNNIHNAWHTFSKNNTSYLYLMSEYYDMVTYSGNMFETIYLGEYILDMAKKHDMANDPSIYTIYDRLLYNYAVNDEKDKVESLLPDATSYYSRFPYGNITEAYLYYNIGAGFAGSMKYKLAEKYYNLAKKKIRKGIDDNLLPFINQELEECEKLR